MKIIEQPYKFKGGDQLTATKLNTLVNSIEKMQLLDHKYAKGLNRSPEFGCRRFVVELASSTSIRIYVGSVLGKDDKVYTLTCDTDQDYYTLTGLSASSTTYYIYVSIDYTNETLTANKKTDFTFALNEYLIATITTDASGNISDFLQNHLGDIIIKDIPDSEVTITASSQTLEQATDGHWRLKDAQLAASQEKFAKLNSSNVLTWTEIEETDEKVAIAEGITSGYLGTSNDTGVLHCDGYTIQKTPGVDFIELSCVLDASGGVASSARGIPSGGYTYQALVKNSNNDYDVKWDWVRAH